jgi:hypothetical protein
MPLIFALFGLGFVWAVGTGFFGISPSMDGDTFYLMYFAGCALMGVAAATSKIEIPRLLFACSAVCLFLGIFLAPAFNSIHAALMVSSGLTLIGAIHTAYFAYLRPPPP